LPANDLLLVHDLADGGELDRLLHDRQHVERRLDPELAEALEIGEIATPEELHTAGEAAFAQRHQGAHAVGRVGGIQVEKDERRVLGLDVLREPYAADELDGVDADAAQRSGEALQDAEVGVDDEAKRWALLATA